MREFEERTALFMEEEGAKLYHNAIKAGIGVFSGELCNRQVRNVKLKINSHIVTSESETSPAVLGCFAKSVISNEAISVN